jgi:hypothetical protein
MGGSLAVLYGRFYAEYIALQYQSGKLTAIFYTPTPVSC